MKCQHCGKQIANDSKKCSFCGKPVGPNGGGAWYKKWWIWLIAALVVAGIVITCILVFSGKGDNKVEPKKIETTASTTIAPVTEATLVPASTAPKKSIDDIIAEDYEKVGIGQLHNNADKYKGKKIITVIQTKDLGDSALYGTVEKDGKTLSFLQFVFDDPKEFKDVRRGDSHHEAHHGSHHGSHDEAHHRSHHRSRNDCACTEAHRSSDPADNRRSHHDPPTGDLQ